MKKLILLILLSLSLFSGGYATGGKEGTRIFIFLIWEPEKGASGYNIYRKESLSSSYPANPINSSPIRRLNTCSEFEALIPVHSEESKAITKVFGGKSSTFKPCSILTITDKDTIALRKLKVLGGLYYKISLAFGWAYFDEGLVDGKEYHYEIRAIGKDGKEIKTVATDISAKAGKISTLNPPSNFRLIAGDNMVQLLWSLNQLGIKYEIERKKSGGLPKRINESSVIPTTTISINGDTIPESHTFIDFLKFDEYGNPMKRYVLGDSIDGPFNGTKYYYRIRAIDILGRPGTWSSWFDATPRDRTNPAVPYGLEVLQENDGLLIRWMRVSKDIKGNKEILGIKGYKVYRFTSNDNLSDSVIIASLVPQPPDTTTAFVSFKDTDPSLRSPYGERMFYYRIRTIDNSDNISSISSAVGGYLPDTTPPNPPVNLSGEGFEDYIKLRWEKPSSSSPDIAGYMIYRGICGGDTVCIDSIVSEKRYQCKKWGYKIYPLNLIGTINDTMKFEFEDRTVPSSSPVCYRYSVKSFDRSGNISDTSRTICIKLREKTPPPQPVISGLKARNKAIKVEWVAPPVQDLFGFIVERAEDINGPWIRVNDSLIFPERCNCEDIPGTNIWAQDSIFSFVDTTVIPQNIYYYRVRGADYLGNIGEPSIPVETYTFDYTTPIKPFDLKIEIIDGCKIRISWKPEYDDELSGFVVFRSENPSKGFIQISPLLKNNEFIDRFVEKNKDYWYKVQCIGKLGNRSEVSNSIKGRI